MAKTLVQNISDGPVTLPVPYKAMLPRGGRGVVADTVDNVLANVGGANAVKGSLLLSPALESEPATILPTSAADIPDGSIGTAELAPRAATFAKQAVFVSAEITGNGASQSTPHDLGVVPVAVEFYLTGGPAAYTQPTITPGAHTSANVLATVTTGWKYRFTAYA